MDRQADSGIPLQTVNSQFKEIYSEGQYPYFFQNALTLFQTRPGLYVSPAKVF